MAQPLRVVVVCGGSSGERGISLNSARCIYDHLQGADVELDVLYFNQQLDAFAIPAKRLYSNTPQDFDYSLDPADALPEWWSWIRERGCRLAFPAIHGAFGEDGVLQAVLEREQLAFVGSSSGTCLTMYDKELAHRELLRLGMTTRPALHFKDADLGAGDWIARIEALLREGDRGFIVKPTRGGSSLGVHAAAKAAEADAIARSLFGAYPEGVLIEPRHRGREFTIIVLQGADGVPTPLVPLEIVCDGVFSNRLKYLATNEVEYRCPPSFSDATVDEIRRRAASLFAALEMRDFARLDGWVLDSGEVLFSDLNPISGMDQNSLMFIQAAQAGLRHRDVFRLIVRSACARQGILFDERPPTDSESRRPVTVLFGGVSSERHVSVLSGTNVWLKLERSPKYHPEPMLLTHTKGSTLQAPTYEVWRLPLAYGLYPSVENIVAACRRAEAEQARMQRWRGEIRQMLGMAPLPVTEFLPQRDDFESLMRLRLVLIALHGGIGENGELQKRFDQAGVAYTGPGAAASQLCIDKERTNDFITALGIPGVSCARNVVYASAELVSRSDDELRSLWEQLGADLGTPTIIAKPNDDGCSVGVVRLVSSEELITYARALARASKSTRLDGAFQHHAIVEMPTQMPKRLIFEAFIETLDVDLNGNRLVPADDCPWIEATVGVVGPEGAMRSLTPSMTVRAGAVLTFEEKFQKGEGVNFTPPPEALVSADVLRAGRERVEAVARGLKLRSLSRIDIFLHRKSGRIIVIEANTVPAMSSATVLYHQALCEEPALFPREFLEGVLDEADEVRPLQPLEP